MRARLAALAVVLLLVVSACGSDDDKKDAEKGLSGVEVTGEFAAEPGVDIKNVKVSKLTTEVVSEGDGPEVTENLSALIQLSIYSGADGSVLYSTWQTGQAVTVGPASPPLIEGLQDALDGQSRGSRVALATPAEDAVGQENVAQIGLEPGDAIVAVADILSVQKADPLDGPDGRAARVPGGVPKLVEKDGNVTGFDWAGVDPKPAKLQVIPIIEGKGPEITANRLVTFDYFGEVYKAQKPFDESFTGEPITFAVGAGSLIPAWDEGLVGVKEGSRVMIITPPDKGYGAQGNGNIPPNSTLVFVIDVLGVDG